MKCKRIVVSGRVQGVGFREFVRREVAALGGLAGYVKNLKGGSVEVVVSGEDEKIKQLAERCRRGPLLASISSVSVEDFEFDEDYDSFCVR